MTKITLNRSKAPYLPFVFALSAGIFCADQVPASPVYYKLINFFLILLTILNLILLQKQLRPKINGLPGFVFMLILFFFGWQSVWKSFPQINQQHFSHYSSSVVFGIVADEPVSRGNQVQVNLKVTALKEKRGGVIPSTGRIILFIDLADNESLQLHYGDELFFEEKYQSIPPRYNPYGFDYQAYLHHKNIWYRAYLTGRQVKKTGRVGGNPIIRTTLYWRRKMLSKFSAYVDNKEAKALLSTLVLGYRADLDQRLVNLYSATGTIHILSVSGMHVGLVFVCLAFVLRGMENDYRLAVIRLLLLLLGIWFYVFLSGLSPSVLRAGWMISFFLVGSVFRRQNNRFNHLAASAFFLLLDNPKYLFDVGFQLSYLAVAGLIWALLLRERNVKSSKRLRHWFSQYLWLSSMAQLATFPLILYYFHAFPVYFLVANLFITLPVSLIIYGGFILLLLPFSIINGHIAHILTALITYMNQFLQTIATWPYATLQGVWISSLQCLLFYCTIVMVLFAFQMTDKRALYGGLLSFLFAGFLFDQKKYQQYHQSTFIAFNLKKDIALFFMQDGIAVLYTNLVSSVDRQLQWYVVPPVEALTNKDQLIWITGERSINEKDLFVDKHHIRVKRREVAILDGEDQKVQISDAVNYVLIRNNPPLWRLQQLSMQKRENLWILDGSNTDFTINQITKLAKRINIPYYILKNNFAYVWNAH